MQLINRIKLISIMAAALLCASPLAYSQQHREFAITLWNWNPSCQNLTDFTKWGRDFKSIGGTEIYISAAWNRLEPQPGEYHFGYITRRLAIMHKLGLKLGVRINSYWGGATPAWLKVNRWEYASGKIAQGGIPSINDPRFWKAFAPLCQHLARYFRGRDVQWCAFIGSQAENKYGEWCTYDPASQKLWRQGIRAKPRPAWLTRVVGNAPVSETPPVPGMTDGVPDQSPTDLVFIAFRQQNWRVALRRFNNAIRAGDPKAHIVVQLGESYRRLSAEMSNLDYYGMSRGANQILQSYDFWWHAHQPLWEMQADLAAFQGITLKPVVIEFDNPHGMTAVGYTQNFLSLMGRTAVAQGCGIEECNAGGNKALPSDYSFMRAFGKACQAAGAEQPLRPDPRKTILIFVSKWANYCYREPTEWLHLAQFGAWRMLTRNGCTVRMICEDNLKENLSHYLGLYVAFSPPQLIPPIERSRLLKLESTIPAIVEVAGIPHRVRNKPLVVENFKGPHGEVLKSGRRPSVDVAGTGWKFYAQDAAGYQHSPMRIAVGSAPAGTSCATNFNDAAYIKLHGANGIRLPDMLTIRAKIKINDADQVGLGFYAHQPTGVTDGFSGMIFNRSNGQIQLCCNGMPVGSPRPAPFLGWKANRFYTVAFVVNTRSGALASVWYHGHHITGRFAGLPCKFSKANVKYAGFFGVSGSNVKATGYVANFYLGGHPAGFTGHGKGIGKFERYALGLPIEPELVKPQLARDKEVILGYPLAYVWNSETDHAGQQRVLDWAIHHSWR